MKNFKYIIAAGMALMLGSCTKDLDQAPKGALREEALNTPKAAEGLVVAAYAMMDNVYQSNDFAPISAIFNPASNWSYSDVRSGDAYKGGGGTGDIAPLGNMELGNVTADNFLIARKWRALYIGVSRCNKALKSLNSLSDAEFPLKARRIAEVRVLRAHYYFDLKRNFRTFPYIDESVPLGEEGKVPNNLTEQQLWDKIIADIQAGINIPYDGQDKGRINKYVAYAYLTKAYMFTKKYTEAVASANEVINSGKYNLLSNLESLYSDPLVEHNGENILAIETSVNDGGTLNGNIDWGDLLTSPSGPAYGGGDGFHRPTQNLVNSFKVDPITGLPLLDTYNNSDLAPTDVTTPVDPRLDHAIGRPGITWKDYKGEVYSVSWARDANTYGPYSKKKNLISPNSTLRAAGGFPWARGALNFPFIKYSDVLLWKAEALIELNQNLDEARELINQVRTRAKNSPVVKKLDGVTPAANYVIGTYPALGWTQDYARKALRFERRLELCLEGHRFYDLVRWNAATDFLNNYYQTEGTKRPYLAVGNFVAPKLNYLPIPQVEVDLARGGLIQDPNY